MYIICKILHSLWTAYMNSLRSQCGRWQNILKNNWMPFILGLLYTHTCRNPTWIWIFFFHYPHCGYIGLVCTSVTFLVAVLSYTLLFFGGDSTWSRTAVGVLRANNLISFILFWFFIYAHFAVGSSSATQKSSFSSIIKKKTNGDINYANASFD